MRHIRSASFIGVTALLSIGLLGGCSSTSNAGGSGTSSNGAKKSYALEGVTGLSSDPFFVSLMCGATKEAKAEGSSIHWNASTSLTVTDSQSNLDAALLKNPPAVVLSPVSDALSAPIQKAMSQGTPVFNVNTDVNPKAAYTAVLTSTDFTEWAKYVQGQIGESGSMGVLGGIPGIPALAVRWQPVVSAIKKAAPNVKILPTQYDSLDRTKATSLAAALLTAHPDLKALYAISGPAGEGAVAAVKEAGKTGQVKVFAFDATPGEVSALKAGDISGLIAQPPTLMGREVVKQAISYLDSGSGASGPVKVAGKKDTYLPLKVLTKDNVADSDSADYLYTSTCSD